VIRQKPKLVFFFDEAHLLFDEASKALLGEIEQTVRLIRSKGIGIYFVTQVPADVPNSVEAAVTVVSPKGVPTPLAGTRLLAPDSLMSAVDPAELQLLCTGSRLQAKYGTPIDRESAHEIITARIQGAQQQATGEATAKQPQVDAKARAREEREAERTARAEERERAARDRANRRMLETAARTGAVSLLLGPVRT
jgi:uncharacterized protein